MPSTFASEKSTIWSIMKANCDMILYDLFKRFEALCFEDGQSTPLDKVEKKLFFLRALTIFFYFLFLSFFFVQCIVFLLIVIY